MSALADGAKDYAYGLLKLASVLETLEQECAYYKATSKMLVQIVDRQSVTEPESAQIAEFERRVAGD